MCLTVNRSFFTRVFFFSSFFSSFLSLSLFTGLYQVVDLVQRILLHVLTTRPLFVHKICIVSMNDISDVKKIINDLVYNFRITRSRYFRKIHYIILFSLTFSILTATKHPSKDSFLWKEKNSFRSLGWKEGLDFSFSRGFVRNGERSRSGDCQTSCPWQGKFLTREARLTEGNGRHEPVAFYRFCIYHRFYQNPSR